STGAPPTTTSAAPTAASPCGGTPTRTTPARRTPRPSSKTSPKPTTYVRSIDRSVICSCELISSILPCIRARFRVLIVYMILF
ncbi:hypothetical protein EE612_043885, partial [Oryza sativa]